MKAKIVFTKSSGVVAWVVRLLSRRPNQPLADVPAHVYIVMQREPPCITGTLYEAICTGVHKAGWTPYDHKDTVAFDLIPQVKVCDLKAYLDDLVEHRTPYHFTAIWAKWATIAANGFNRLLRLPYKASFMPIDTSHALMCSELVVNALYKAGLRFALHKALMKSGNDFSSPTSPNDLYLALSTLT